MLAKKSIHVLQTYSISQCVYFSQCLLPFCLVNLQTFHWLHGGECYVEEPHTLWKIIGNIVDCISRFIKCLQGESRMPVCVGQLGINVDSLNYIHPVKYHRLGRSSRHFAFLSRSQWCSHPRRCQQKINGCSFMIFGTHIVIPYCSYFNVNSFFGLCRSLIFLHFLLMKACCHNILYFLFLL